MVQHTTFASIVASEKNRADQEEQSFQKKQAEVEKTRAEEDKAEAKRKFAEEAPARALAANARLKEAKEAPDKFQRDRILNLIITSWPDTEAAKEAQKMLDSK